MKRVMTGSVKDKEGIQSMEESLGVKTQKLKFLFTKFGYFGHEPTEYSVLEKIFNAYPFSEEDEFIDFGCGLGRVVFFAAHRNCKHAIGVEANQGIYESLLENLKNSKYQEVIQPIFCAAENYKIPSTANKFFFFHPFAVKYFELVYNNIKASLKENPREHYIFLYNFTKSYRKFLEERPEYKQIDYWQKGMCGRGDVCIFQIEC